MQSCVLRFKIDLVAANGGDVNTLVSNINASPGSLCTISATACSSLTSYGFIANGTTGPGSGGSASLELDTFGYNQYEDFFYVQIIAEPIPGYLCPDYALPEDEGDPGFYIWFMQEKLYSDIRNLGLTLPYVEVTTRNARSVVSIGIITSYTMLRSLFM
jgi:hypothetical protein